MDLTYFHRQSAINLISDIIIIFSLPQILSSLQDNNKPVGPVGNVSFIGNVDGQRLSQIMGEYYSHFQVVSGANVTFSVPQREPNMGTWNNLIVSCISKSQFISPIEICY